MIGIFSRVMPHFPNFSPLAAVALFSGVYLNKKYGYLVPLAIYILSDLVIGLHNTVLFTWFSILFIYFLGTKLRAKRTVISTFSYALFSSVFFFIVTNFGVWLMGWYPRTLDGLAKCFTYAIPFFRVSLLSDLIYVIVFFGAYEYFLSRIRIVKAAA